MSPPRPLPDKLFFRIGEVADIVGVKPHVLRYWESEFSSLRPMKTRGSHRQYRRRDVELAMLIKQLLHGEGYTIAGARKRLRELGHDRAHAILPEKASTEVKLRAALLGLREELVDLLASLDSLEATAHDEADAPSQVTVHRAVLMPGAQSKRAGKSYGEPQAEKTRAQANASESLGAHLEATLAHAKTTSPHAKKS